jgi:hypothetical protein
MIRTFKLLLFGAVVGALLVPAQASAGFPRFPAASSGGLSTVTTSAPATGDGSSGSPVTVRTSSTTQSGYMSATQATQLSDVGLVGKWARDRAHEIAGYVPALNVGNCKGGPFGWAFYAGTGATSVNTSVEGGGTSPGAGAINFLTNYLTAFPKTGSLGLAYKVQVAVPVSGRTSALGLSDAGLTAGHSMDFRSAFATDATHAVFKLGSVATAHTTTIVPTTLYNVTQVCNGTNCVERINDADAVTIAQSNVPSDEKWGLYDFNTTGGDLIVSEVVVCLP